ncbi:PREDICTED: uncharacterized protein LOC104766014 isoform X1 [Camelina sativa]|uniref:Uncharacterized protein LOC104766014 isoform X1 n=1 Tax=Camelina sativa TaxID=90675 RepID=A0ABM1RCK3_CAMSA|nr:PREDICTED: uncharacterized protein LOC104766014 isoform X1 [Camelina sativa]XP_019096741.1 PREDICTED: uncharacterized protein LOC104766014 isoform X1 [Camelina sativa]XP_019096742.1 PREDICTED: uncharacterized protein LOC104766014 isoform X1 [Camelina sativa]
MSSLLVKKKRRVKVPTIGVVDTAKDVGNIHGSKDDLHGEQSVSGDDVIGSQLMDDINFDTTHSHVDGCEVENDDCDMDQPCPHDAANNFGDRFFRDDLGGEDVMVILLQLNASQKYVEADERCNEMGGDEENVRASPSVDVEALQQEGEIADSCNTTERPVDETTMDVQLQGEGDAILKEAESVEGYNKTEGPVENETTIEGQLQGEGDAILKEAEPVEDCNKPQGPVENETTGPPDNSSGMDVIPSAPDKLVTRSVIIVDESAQEETMLITLPEKQLSLPIMVKAGSVSYDPMEDVDNGKFAIFTELIKGDDVIHNLFGLCKANNLFFSNLILPQQWVNSLVIMLFYVHEIWYTKTIRTLFAT